MGARDGDEEELEALLRAISAEHARPEETEVRRAAGRVYGRLDSLDMLREVLREEQQLRELQARIADGSEESSSPRHAERASMLRIPSLIDGAGGSRGRGSWRKIGLAVAALIVVGVGLSRDVTSRLLRAIGARGSVATLTVATRAAELDTVDLPDGSHVILAPNSSVRYAIASHGGSRELQLEGEAYFDVKHDGERPFRVQTRRAMVEDLGTTFVVREYAADSRASVTVRSGAVALRSSDGASASPINLRPGDGAYVDSSGAIARFNGDPEGYGTWTTGRLEFDAVPLPEVLSRLARWYDVEFRLSDSTLDRQYFTGGFDAVSLSRALEILGPIVHARFDQQGRVVMVTPLPGSR